METNQLLKQEMKSSKFTASIIYNRDRIRLLSETISKAFRYWPLLITSTVCILMLAFSVLYYNGTLSVDVIAFSCIILTSIHAPARIRADNDFKAVGAKDIPVSYFFGESDFLVEARGEETKKKYDEVILVFEDHEYLYIFTDKTSAFMIEKKSLKPNSNDFKLFLQSKTNTRWKYDSIIFMLSTINLLKKQ